MTQPYKYVYVGSSLFYWPGREKEYTSPEETYKEAVRNGNINILVFERSNAIQATLRCSPDSVRTRFYVISLILSSINTEIEHVLIKKYTGKLIMEVDYKDGREIDVECITMEEIDKIKVDFWKMPYPFYHKEMTLFELDELINEYA